MIRLRMDKLTTYERVSDRKTMVRNNWLLLGVARYLGAQSRVWRAHVKEIFNGRERLSSVETMRVNEDDSLSRAPICGQPKKSRSRALCV